MRLCDRYLYLSRHNIYYFRVIVLIGAAACKNRQEYRKSLKTRNPQKARFLGRAMRLCYEEQSISGGLSSVEWTEVKKILDQKLVQLIAEEKARIKKIGPYTVGTEKVWEHLNLPYQQSLLTTLSKDRRSDSHAKDVSVPQFLEEMVSSFFEGQNVDQLLSEEQYLQVCEAVLHMVMQFTRERISINKVARSFSSKFDPNIVVQDSQQGIKPVKGTLISEVIEKYCGEMVSGGNWKSTTVSEYRALYELLLQVINDGPITSVNYDTARYFKTSLLRLPANMKKKPQYREKSVSELLQSDIPKDDLLSISRVNDNLTRVSSLFSWAERNGYISINPFVGLKIKEKQSALLKRLPFEKNDIDKLFGSTIYKDGEFKHPYYYWLPLMGIYTGARLEEICQLHLSDIYPVGELYVFDINNAEGKKVKTESAKRLVPVHKRLIVLGLIEYMKELEGNGEERLFPELKPIKGKYSHYASKWFGDYRKKCGVTHPKKPFHSFRHTVINLLKQIHVEEALIKALVGHANESITTGLYGAEYSPVSLQPIVDKLSFDIDVPAYSTFK